MITMVTQSSGNLYWGQHWSPQENMNTQGDGDVIKGSHYVPKYFIGMTFDFSPGMGTVFS